MDLRYKVCSNGAREVAPELSTSPGMLSSPAAFPTLGLFEGGFLLRPDKAGSRFASQLRPLAWELQLEQVGPRWQ